MAGYSFINRSVAVIAIGDYTMTSRNEPWYNGGEDYGNQKAVLPLKEPPMTIIAAMRESDASILIASDTEGTEEGGIRLNNRRKLRHHPHAPIAWGCSGNITIGIEDFAPWLESYNWPPADWRTFRRQTTETLAKLNAEQRQLVQLSGVRLQESDTANCLLVGWLNHPEIYEFNDRGIATAYWERGFQAIGTGKLYAWTAYKTLQHCDGLEPLQVMMIIMHIVVTTAPECGFPYHIWRVTEKGITTGLEEEKQEWQIEKKIYNRSL